MLRLDFIAISERAKRHVGEFYVVDTRRHFIVSKHIHLVMFAREMGALKPWEHVYRLGAAGAGGRERIDEHEKKQPVYNRTRLRVVGKADVGAVVKVIWRYRSLVRPSARDAASD
jgi:hypothetical protein